MKAAEVYAELSYAKRLKVGAIVVKDNRVISIGYNGTPSGWDNTCEDILYKNSVEGEDAQELIRDGWIFGCDKDTTMWVKTATKPEVIHAEANAIAKLAKTHESGLESDMFITHAPCMDCAKLIFGAGIKQVYFKKQYRDSSGIEFLNKCGVYTEQIN